MSFFEFCGYSTTKLCFIILCTVNNLNYQEYFDLNNMNSCNGFKFIEILKW
ncbi:hypothetical protein ECHHL_0737 [Ehrlichia chaffeensis str. Heartland]|uniref:Uncharacterized protein n=1 Tax=Ehrlichia chaffeensis (strain ATCC CRL-10679 / Arkansas) TaxID=205920 RepID=Q2GG04_EHRCR|nr:hypothetical protein ECH_0833 [Ehrlichia chaffeensis str. Arkansas]AHX03883.1 hypothetical protein ECHHL_0737 [Ehrlichia chaffeensis str. Heartland]AHX06377.1 hypothetical protein ECHLIB_0310 [Ehrlichia chaffeensis str. Liberty]AHX08049.1 hypothetical protein ECHOSC_0748 [Ehrlichia chaffeensis str. Osceola]AHX09003.1 hypothetical protein ECHSTV_0304 [Ehrlichia chaffeensis str. Saint Vincent]AHX09353.1 hypothetical protein ECHWAK_0311 [Ehrlichia chaffeensis str. Wakulla]AHX10302.1 hypotheti